MNLFQAARRYTEAGLAVIPLWPDKRKNPHLSSFSEYTRRLPTVAEWANWANRWPGANLGLITGYWQNLVCLDFDDEAGYLAWANGPGWGIVGQTWQVRTGRGYHVWFQVCNDPGSSRLYSDGVHDVLLRARGGYCIVPPSVHHSGRLYQTVHKVKPLQVDTIDHFLLGWQEKTRAKAAGSVSYQGRLPLPGRLVYPVRIEEIISIPAHSKPNARGAYQVFCPFHEDGKPSAWLNVDQQRFGCNACWPGLWWDTVNVYAKLKGLDNDEVYKLWGQKADPLVRSGNLSPRKLEV